jgi:predicted P-loop ATPase/GTPase
MTLVVAPPRSRLITGNEIRKAIEILSGVMVHNTVMTYDLRTFLNRTKINK